MLSLVITFRPILVAVRPLGGWGYGFEYRLGYGCSSLVFVLCVIYRNLQTRQPGPDLGSSITDKIKLHFID